MHDTEAGGAAHSAEVEAVRIAGRFGRLNWLNCGRCTLSHQACGSEKNEGEFLMFFLCYFATWIEICLT
jgi:hypothetical protein